MSADIVQLTGTAGSVLQQAIDAGCDKVLVLAIKNDGSNFYKASDNCTLKDLAWLTLCAQNSLHQMVEK